MRTLRSLFPLIDLHMFVVAALAIGGTYLCRRADFRVDLPADLVGIAVIFPVVFSIASAYTRREEALKSFAALKADGAALYYAHRDWPEIQNQLGEDAAQLVHDLLSRIARYFEAPAAQKDDALRAVYDAFNAISLSHRDILRAGASRSEISRLGAYLRQLIAEFEAMRNLDHYRTPVTLRAFSRFFLTAFPVLFTPYFAFVGFPEHPSVGYFVAFTYSVVLVGLDNVQEQLESPYDGIGPDDLRLRIADDYVSLLTASQSHNGSEPATPHLMGADQ